MNLNDELQYNILLDEVDELELEMIELDKEIRIEELLEHERVLVINKINLQETLEQIRIDKDLRIAESVLDNIEAGIYYVDREEFTKRLINKKKKWLKEVIVGKTLGEIPRKVVFDTLKDGEIIKDDVTFEDYEAMLEEEAPIVSTSALPSRPADNDIDMDKFAKDVGATI